MRNYEWLCRFLKEKQERNNGKVIFITLKNGLSLDLEHSDEVRVNGEFLIVDNDILINIPNILFID